MSQQMRHDTWGTGDWALMPDQLLPKILEQTLQWRAQLRGIERPWLCWCVHPEWCVLQQELVLRCGWTPIVCADVPTRSVRLLDGAMAVNFRDGLDPPGAMWMHFAMEFVFRYTERLAFWHSDLLPPLEILKPIAAKFEKVQDGTMMAVDESLSWRRQLRDAFRLRMKTKNDRDHRWFELIGCTTASASESQFANGCGWWRCVDKHPNARSAWRDRVVFYDHGVGVWLWNRFCDGQVRDVGGNLERYHYHTRKFVKGQVFDKALALDNYDIESLRTRLNLS